MQSKTLIGAVVLVGMSGSAFATSNVIHVADNVNDFSTFRQNYADEYNGGSLSGTRLNQIITNFTSVGSVGDNTSGRMDFGSNLFGQDNMNFGVNISGNDAGAGVADLFIGTTGQLRPIDFNAGNNDRPGDNSLHAVAFGNQLWQSNTMTFDFDPTQTVTAFGFSYEDIGDVRGSLTVDFVDSIDGTIDTRTIPIAAGNLADGFMSLVADTGYFIDSITFTQTFAAGDANDGFIFYNFSTVQSVPLPPAALAGLGLLGGIAGFRKLRQR